MISNSVPLENKRNGEQVSLLNYRVDRHTPLKQRQGDDRVEVLISSCVDLFYLLLG